MQVWQEPEHGDEWQSRDMDEPEERCCDCGMVCTGLDLVCSICWEPMCDRCHEGLAGVCRDH
jgi:hypothetical protein